MKKLLATFGLFLITISLFAQQVGEMTMDMKEGESIHQKKGYSPYGGRYFPTQVYWGDTHLHTSNSLDARAFGTVLGPEEAYKLARGEEITATHGEKVKLSRPLDWLVVADHSDGMGAMNEIIKGNPNLMSDATVKDWHKRINEGGKTALMATMDVINSFALGKIPPILLDDDFSQTVWDRYIDIAEKYNDPGTFTTIIGYEWTSTENGNNLHRNVLYRDNGERAKKMLPYTTSESFNPEDLWKWMERYEVQTNGNVLALAHNGNLSNGIMFPVEVNPATGKALDGNYAKNRIKWEPLYEITQIKGDGEAHPLLSPNDEFADYENWEKGNLNLSAAKTDDMLQYEYGREALKNGLKLEEKLGTNPYKFGVVGSTDSHTSLATAEEENFFGKHSGNEPSAHRSTGIVGEFEGNKIFDWELVASGYAGVWATENTREALFDAMARKEVYATTGPRIIVRFFGGWEFSEEDALNRLPAEIGYSKGVPMGGDLRLAPSGKSPSFLVGALKDPYSGNLDRIQIVKGWLDSSGKTHEKVYDVVWSDMEQRKLKNGKVPDVGNTVDIKNATWSNSIGRAELIGIWKDPDFDPKLRSFYYARVLEIPTPRWTAYDAKRFGVEMPKESPMTTTERAYTSPIWYTP
ncbi:DUF3604 domain-containing protein [Lutimonas sp.]|uniref:DUF3604 domain-containing protein n=1 Tax=Lutimonas sp. TaxID=1872403 RepID=UPI003D9AFFEA